MPARLRAPARRGCRAHIRPPTGPATDPGIPGILGIRRNSRPEALPNVRERPPQPGLDGVDRRVEPGGKLVPAQAAVIGEQHQAAALLVKGPHAGQQSPELVAGVAPGQRIGALGWDLHRLRLLLERYLRLLANEIDRTVAGDRHHPGDGRCDGRIELSGRTPDLEIGLLDDLVRKVGSTQYTERRPR